jgi:hypothetical protein
VRASTWDEFLPFLQQSAHLGKLPTVDKEIGDTWICMLIDLNTTTCTKCKYRRFAHKSSNLCAVGSQSDPTKQAMFRAAQRLRAQCLVAAHCTLDDPRFYAFSRLLIKAAEHTWGEDQKSFLPDWCVHWLSDCCLC